MPKSLNIFVVNAAGALPRSLCSGSLTVGHYAAPFYRKLPLAEQEPPHLEDEVRSL